MTAMPRMTDDQSRLPEIRSLRGFEMEEEEMEIDLLELFYMLMSHWVKLLAALIIGALIVGGYAYFGIKPTYKSTSKIYVVAASNDSVVDLTDLNIGTSLKKDYQELMMSYPVLDLIIEELQLDMTSTELAKMYAITNPTDTRILSITATSTDPEQARLLADTMVSVAITYLPKTMGTEQPNIAQYAKVATSKAAPSYSKFAIIGAMLGLILVAGFYVVTYLLDDTIKDAEELEKAFGFVPLTSIPDSSLITGKSAFGQMDYGKKIRRKKGRK